MLQVKLNKLVNPGKAIADYRTEITGIAAADLDGVKCSLSDVQVHPLLTHADFMLSLSSSVLLHWDKVGLFCRNL